MWNFIRSKTFLFNFIASLLLFFGILFVVYNYLDDYTLHGETITVPDLRGMKPENIAEFLSDKKLRYEVIDSSVYDPKKDRGSVVDQDPAPESKVKENRTIYLMLNKNVPQKVKMPDLVDASFRQAEAILLNAGLKVGELTYKPDMAKNAVLEQRYRGQKISAGTSIQQGAKIDLILGNGLSDTKVEVPNLLGLTLTEAIELLNEYMLNEGAVIADASVKDTARAIVYRQIPTPTTAPLLNQGAGIDLFITQNESLFPKKLPANE